MILNKGKMVKISNPAKLIALFAAVFLFSCSPVRYVPEDRYLLSKVNVEVDNSQINKEEARSHIRQKENYKILGFAKFYLWLYNLSSKKKNNGWLKRIGEPPVVYDPALTSASEDRLKQYLANRGYFRAQVETEVKLKEKKQKANVNYVISTGEQYRVHDIDYHISDSGLDSLFHTDSVKSFIRPETPFDFNLLEQQRENIVRLFRNNGYFYFNKDEVSYIADSSQYEREIALDLFVGSRSNADSVRKFTPHYLNNFYISVLPGATQLTSETEPDREFADTVKWDNNTLYQSQQITYRPSLFDNLLQMQSGDLYKLSEARNTFNAFNRLRQFRFIDIQFEKPSSLPDTNLLDCNIRLAPMSKQAVSFDLEGTNTSGNLGVAGNLNYKHRNLFKGAEIFQVNFKGAVERQQRVIKGNTEYFNTRELGVESNLTIPKLIGPGQAINAFRDYLPKTVFTLGYNFQRRPEYTRTISNFRFGYNWMTSERLSHNWNIIDFNMVNLYQFDPGFIDFIKDLYIKSSFTDHLILAMNYSLVHNTQEIETRSNYSYLRFNVETAGNALDLLARALDKTKVQSVDTLGLGTTEYYRFFNTRYAQYVKSDIEFRYGYIIDRYNSVVGRAFLGVGVPYGNFDVLPFEKKYFTGGANGIRAWQVRSLGPGTYRAPAETYPNQSSDIKLEANLEYRFHLISFLEGALFLDAGNIWAINKKDNRPGALFKFDEFYKQIAVGTGAGFRFDFSYFIFRLDVGMKLRVPSQETGNGWIIGNRPYSGDDFNLSFAIGYPF
jgi:outer membrane protein assembly factor BamA